MTMKLMLKTISWEKDPGDDQDDPERFLGSYPPKSSSEPCPVRATFRLPQQVIDLLSVIAAQLGIKQKLILKKIK